MSNKVTVSQALEDSADYCDIFCSLIAKGTNSADIVKKLDIPIYSVTFYTNNRLKLPKTILGKFMTAYCATEITLHENKEVQL